MNGSDPIEPSALWTDGWYGFAQRRPSPNFGPRPTGVELDLIVLHSISLPPGQYGGDAVEQLFTNTLDCDLHPYFKRLQGLQVSAHFFIRRHGDLQQFVSADQRAWHAGVSHYLGRDNCNDNSIGIELEGIEGGRFETVQYETLAALCAALCQRYPIAHIAGHEHVAAGRKSDPGSGFDWSLLQQLLGCATQCFPAGVLARPLP